MKRTRYSGAYGLGTHPAVNRTAPVMCQLDVCTHPHVGHVGHVDRPAVHLSLRHSRELLLAGRLALAGYRRGPLLLHPAVAAAVPFEGFTRRPRRV